MLLDNGVQIETRDNDGHRPLMNAAANGHSHLAKTQLLSFIHIVQIIIIIIIKNEKIRVTLCENAAGALYIVK